MANVSAKLNKGDVVGDLTGLKDCASGRCVNVRFNGVAAVPEGWTDACTPKNNPRVRTDFYLTVKYREVRKNTYQSPDVIDYDLENIIIDNALFKTGDERKAAVIAAVPDDDKWQMNWTGARPTATARQLVNTFFCNDAITKTILETPGEYKKNYPSSWRIDKYYSYKCNNVVHQPGNESWPSAMCSEVIYDAANAQFKDGSCGHDKNMPAQLQGNYPCISLCDAEGNKVVIGATGSGITVIQRKYNQTVLIDPSTFHVINQKAGGGKTVLVSAGHSNSDPGAVRSDLGLKEADIVTDLRNLVASKLKQSCIDTITDGEGLNNQPLSEAQKLIAQSGIAVEIHLNSGPKSANGVETVALPAHKSLAQELSAAVSGVMGNRLRGDQGYITPEQTAVQRPGFVLKGGLILEVFFLSNDAELATYQEKKNDVAQAIADVLKKHTW